MRNSKNDCKRGGSRELPPRRLTEAFEDKRICRIKRVGEAEQAGEGEVTLKEETMSQILQRSSKRERKWGRRRRVKRKNARGGADGFTRKCNKGGRRSRVVQEGRKKLERGQRRGDTIPEAQKMVWGSLGRSERNRARGRPHISLPRSVIRKKNILREQLTCQP